MFIKYKNKRINLAQALGYEKRGEITVVVVLPDSVSPYRMPGVSHSEIHIRCDGDYTADEIIERLDKITKPVDIEKKSGNTKKKS